MQGKKSTSATTEAGSTPEKLRGVIEFSNVNFAYPSRPDTKVRDLAHNIINMY